MKVGEVNDWTSQKECTGKERQGHPPEVYTGRDTQEDMSEREAIRVQLSFSMVMVPPDIDQGRWVTQTRWGWFRFLPGRVCPLLK